MRKINTDFLDLQHCNIRVFKMKLIIFLTYFICINNALGEELNLFGEAGQAYSIEINLGHPHQKLNVIIDTGSTTLAVASYPRIDSDIYFHADNSSSVFKTGKVIEARYSQGMWLGTLVTDYIQFSSLPSIPEVRSDIALIATSDKFFMNGSTWQGLLGLAYLPVGAWGVDVEVESWLDSLERTLKKQIAFQLQLCGPYEVDNSTHCGYFRIIEEVTDQTGNDTRATYNPTYVTPVVRKSWYEVGVLSVRVIDPSDPDNSHLVCDNRPLLPNADMCKSLNAEKSIVDSGTTNIRLPHAIFKQIVEKLKTFAQKANLLILDEFWYHGEAACWPVPQMWDLPTLGIDLLSIYSDDEYFTLLLSPHNYMRVDSANNNTGKDGAVSEYCYKLGLEDGKTETVLGYTAMEGLKLLFNRSGGWIAWETSDCGPEAKIAGPFKTSVSLRKHCKLPITVTEVPESIQVAEYTLYITLFISGLVLLYLLIPCIKGLFIRSDSSTHISLHAALVDDDFN